MSLVFTADGPIERAGLEIREVVQENEHCRTVGMEFYHEGRLVRRDVWVNMFRGVEATAEVRQ